MAQILAVEINYKDFNTFEEILQPEFQFETSLVDEVRLELRALASVVLKNADKEQDIIPQVATLKSSRELSNTQSTPLLVTEPALEVVEEPSIVPEKERVEEKKNTLRPGQKIIKRKSTTGDASRGRKSAKSGEKEHKVKTPSFGDNIRRSQRHEERKAVHTLSHCEPEEPRRALAASIKSPSAKKPPQTYTSRAFSSNKKSGVAHSFVDSSATREIVMTEEEEATVEEEEPVSSPVQPFPLDESSEAAPDKVPEGDPEAYVETAPPQPEEPVQ